MLIATAALLFLLDLASFTWLAERVRRRPLPFAAAIGFGLLVAWQAVVVAALSPFAAVNGVSLAAASLIPPVAAILLARRRTGGVPGAAVRGMRSLGWTARAHGWVGALLVPLAGLLAVVAAAYAPSNWDSMTYHLARVAHWLRNGSVASYQTGILRQNILAPGAEYLLLGLQAVARSDRLANGPQLLAWLLAAASAAPLARLAGAPRAVASWAGPIVATAPMLVLQATSTQNDLIAAALTLAIVVACLPFLHRAPRAAGADALLLAAVIAAGFLVKVTTIVCAAPVIVAALVGGVRAIRAWPLRRAVAILLGGAVIAGSVAGPQIVRMALADTRSVALTAPFVFPLHGEWGAREANLRLALVRHLPSSANILPDLAGTASALPPLHEDLAANPVQSVFAFAGILLLALGWKRAAPRARWAGTMVLGAWVLFQATFRSNPWISRLETPLFALLPATMGCWRLVRPRMARQGILFLFAAFALAFGLAAAIHNSSRPAMRAVPVHWAADDYYVNRPDQRRMHDIALDAAPRTRCRRIGLWIGEDSFDYPLTWRAMQRGIEVRHVLGPDPWPCLIVSDKGLPPEGTAERGGPWRPILHLAAKKDGATVIAGGVWVRP